MSTGTAKTTRRSWGLRVERLEKRQMQGGEMEEMREELWITRSSSCPVVMCDQVKSVNEYIGDSGKELEGAAEQIVESYMGEYMQVVFCF